MALSSASDDGRSPAKATGGTTGTTPSRFRGDIQGLRALAVITVIVEHAGLGLPGGYVGVDIFFVISGFLITQLLLAEVARTGHLSLTAFYARRARRILPAATVVLVASIIASSLWLGFLRAPSVIRDAVWAAFFAANIRFARQGTDYFAQDLPPSPVQHYWSLAVEEQFYLVWPVVIIVCLTIARRRRSHAGAHTDGGSRAPVTSLVIAVIAISLLSLAWSIIRTDQDPSSAYFSSLTRAWELGVGSLLALVVHSRPVWFTRAGQLRWLQELTALGGVGLIAFACLTLDEATPFPGLIAAVPVLGSGVLLLTGAMAARPTLVARSLALRPAQIIGDWSYSLYLWHWPLLIVPLVHLQRELRTSETLALLGLTFVLSALTYRYVETPFRRPQFWQRRRRAAVALYPASIALVVLTAFAGSAYSTHLSENGRYHPPITLAKNWKENVTDALGRERAVALVRASLRAARQGRPIPTDLKPPLADLDASVADVGDCDYEQDVRKLCPEGDVGSTKTLVLFGNSHGRHWIPAFDEIAKHAGYQAYYLVKPQCVGSLVTPDLGTDETPFTACADFHQWALDQIAALHPDLVVVSTSPTSRGVYDDEGNYYSDKSDINQIVQDGYVSLFRALTPLTDRVVVIKDIPYVNGDPGTCLSTGSPNLGTCLLKETSSHAAASQDQLDAAETAGVEAIDPTPWFCFQGACPSVVGATITHRDAGHMTNEYAEALAAPLGRALGIW